MARIYVGNLAYAAQPTDVAVLFADNGIAVFVLPSEQAEHIAGGHRLKILWSEEINPDAVVYGSKIDMSIDPFTGRNPSYCFVELENAEDAAVAIENLQGKTVRGRPVKINHKTEKRNPTTRLPTKEWDSNRWKPRETSTTNVNGETSFAFDRWNRSDAASHWTAPTEEKRRLYVGGLARIPNQDAVNVEMRQLFEGFNVQAVSKLVSPNPAKYSEPGCHYYCFVDLPSAIEAAEAMDKLHNTETPHGGRYQIRVARFNKPTTVEREQLGVRGDGPYADNRRARSPPPQPQRNLAGSWRRQD